MRTLGPVVTLIVVALLAAGGLAQDAPKAASHEVTIPLDASQRLTATWWDEPAEGAPGVVLVHEADRDRQAWDGLIVHLRRRGIEVLALDMKRRLHGAEAAGDVVAAAKWLVTDGKCDAKRIAVIGACDGAAAAVEAGRREDGGIAAVACLTPPSPGKDGLGIATELTWPDGKPLLLLAHRQDVADAAALRRTLRARPVLVYDDLHTDSVMPDGEHGWFSGTKMFDRVSMVEQTLASFVAATTGSKRDDVILDGLLAQDTTPSGGWTRASHMKPSDELDGWAYLADGRLEFAIRAAETVPFVELEANVTGAPEPTAAAPKPGYIDTQFIVRIELSTGHVTEVGKDEGWESPGGKAPEAAAPIRLIVRHEGGSVTVEGESLAMLPAGARILSRATVELRPRKKAHRAGDDLTEEMARSRVISEAVRAALAEEKTEDKLRRIQIRQDVEDRMTPGRVRLVPR